LDNSFFRGVIVLGSGAYRIGSSVEFDWCCVNAVFTLKKLGYSTIMINYNPETVSTDYDTSDRLYFEPLTYEHVMNIVDIEKPDGVIVQFGGQTPLKLAIPLEKAGVKIIGTSPDNIDRAEDRERFKELLHKLNLRQPENGAATSLDDAMKIAKQIGYPVILRPSYVLGGRAMEIVYDDEALVHYMTHAVKASPEHPVLVDRFLEDAVEVDVDAISDGNIVVIGGIMEHIEEAGIHSGDSACSLPPYSLSKNLIDEIKRQTKALARELNVIGLINIQYAVKDNVIYVLEVNPRASRTIPFVSKAIGVPLAKLAARVMAGKTLNELGFTAEKEVPYISVKEAVFPFIKFPGVDTILGPEMKSTGEVMGIGDSFGMSFAKSQLGAGVVLPKNGKVFISVADKDKPSAVKIAKQFKDIGFNIIGTSGTAAVLEKSGITVEKVLKVKEGRPNIVDYMKNGEISLVVNTTFGKAAAIDSYSIRRTALTYNIPYCTTIPGAIAAAYGIKALQNGSLDVKSLQEYYEGKI